jgi:hypothetical protein
MANTAPRYFIKPTVYRGNSGFHVGGGGRGPFATSIFVRCRSTAVRIKKILKTPLPSPAGDGWERYDAARDARHRKIDMLIHADSRVKSCRR